MKYGDLVQFQRIGRISGVRASSSDEIGRQLVSTFVMSERIAGCLTQAVFPNLKLGETHGSKPLLVLGESGSGKSHLLSVIACLAESSNLADILPGPEHLRYQDGVSPEGFVGVDAVAGRFKVIRIGIRRQESSLRSAVLNQVAGNLAAMGIAHSFQPTSRVEDVRPEFRKMMAAFTEAFPGQGFLVVIDELHEYLAHLKDKAWHRDLNFLLQMGDICKDTAFRLIIGFRKSVFAPHHLHAIEESLTRVKSASDVVTLNVRDLAGVVAARLVPKTPEQKAQVAEHLNRYGGCYGGMAGRMDEFVATFPIHPDCFEVMGAIPFDGEKQIMTVLSDAVESLLEKSIPGNEPGLVAYDSLWAWICGDPVISRLHEVEAVIKCSKSLEDSIRKLSLAADSQMALRLMHALSVQRIVTGDILRDHGVTPVELRDGLCLCPPDIEGAESCSADVLASRVMEVLSAIQKKVGKTLSGPEGEGKWYCLRISLLRRFVTPELVLHWVNAVPFMLLMLTGGLMLLSRFIPIAHKWFLLLFGMHKVFAAVWVLGMPLTILIRMKVHWLHIRTVLMWEPEDLMWMIQSLRSIYDKKAAVPSAHRFNAGQKMNACLVLMYFIGFTVTGVVMLWKASILSPWYIHTALFCMAMGSVGGHLFLALINPSTRVALFGIFHGWAPIEYVEHHHPLSLPGRSRTHGKPSGRMTYLQALTVPKVEIIILAAVAGLALGGVLIFSIGRTAAIKAAIGTVFDKTFVAAVKPADLSTRHQIGEVSKSCTKCHSYTGEIPNTKCESCHAVIRDRMLKAIGYHGTFKGECIKCHKEHLENSRSIVPLDRKTFDHRLASFKLDGRHVGLECDECHKKKRSADAPGSYFVGQSYGLCTDCHRDPHGSQFKISCETCHSSGGWKTQDLKFAHDRDSSFKLAGKHATVECIKCHKPSMPWSSLASARFKGVPTGCIDCHKDPHRKQFTATCTQCHSPAGWKKASLLFDHNKDSKFPLLLKHTTVDCAKCHKLASPASQLASAAFKGLPVGCVDCHKDPHRKQFTAACTACHSVAGWKKEFLSFDHARNTKYPLIAKHSEAACIKCHPPASAGEALSSAQFVGLKTGCADCHKDPHRDQFGRNCTRCHLQPTTWKLDRTRFNHNTMTKYALSGKHAAVDCIKCHKPQVAGAPLGTALFRVSGSNCSACHKVQHPETYGVVCMSCHTMDGWPPKKKEFEHRVKLELAGKHVTAKCSSCHNETRMVYPLQPEKTKYECYTCHRSDDPHKGTLGAVCAKCHSSTGWKGGDLLFNHNTMTRYILNKEHKNVACAKCHEKSRWKPLETTCEGCHPKYYESLPLPRATAGPPAKAK
ncbi:MAG: DUF6079 family protein [bacterium]